jgi:hypothetical protein
VRLGGPASDLDLATNLRRTVYGKVGRDEQNDMLRLFDFPPPTSHSPSRDPTTTPLQQLFVLNSDFIENQSRVLAARIQSTRANSSTADAIVDCYQYLLQRPPTEVEIDLGQRFLAPANDGHATDATRWPLYIQSLLGLNELMYVD